MQEVNATSVRALRCPCGVRMEANHDNALHRLLREHIERAHPYTDAPPKEWVKEIVLSASYEFQHVEVGAEDSLEQEGFGPEPY